MPYYASLHSVTEACWKELLEACGTTVGEDSDDAGQANLSFMDNNCVLMFDFESPMKD